jgi:O-antigen/teichoic acid export membrane protein
MMVIGVGVLIGALGGDAPIVIWTADSRKQQSEWLSAMLFWGLFGSTLACGLWAVVFWWGHFAALRTITASLAVLILSTIPVAVFCGYLMAILTGSERFGLRAAISVADQFAALAGFVVLVLLFGPKTETAILGNLVGLVVGAGIIAIRLNSSLQNLRKFPRIDADIVSGLRMGLRGQPGNLASVLFYRFDVFLVSFFLGPAQVGLYALGVVISEALWQIPSAMAAALFPRTARTLDNGAAEFTCLIIRQVFAIACISGIALALISPVAVPILFGERFRPSVPVIWWLVPGTIALSLAKVASPYLTVRYKSGYSTVFAFIALGVSVPLDLVLIPRMGIQGAALASSAAYLTDAVLLLAALKYEMKVSWRSLFKPSRAEFESYRCAWVRYRSWFRSATFPVARAGRP